MKEIYILQQDYTHSKLLTIEKGQEVVRKNPHDSFFKHEESGATIYAWIVLEYTDYFLPKHEKPTCFLPPADMFQLHPDDLLEANMKKIIKIAKSTAKAMKKHHNPIFPTTQSFLLSNL